jgi:hypothetical protein
VLALAFVLARVALTVVSSAITVTMAITIAIVAVLLTGQDSASSNIHVGYRSAGDHEGNEKGRHHRRQCPPYLRAHRRGHYRLHSIVL